MKKESLLCHSVTALSVSDGAQLNSQWDMSSQCCVQFLRCKSCPQGDILGACVALASESSDCKMGQVSKTLLKFLQFLKYRKVTGK